jgi:hypothetical protein
MTGNKVRICGLGEREKRGRSYYGIIVCQRREPADSEESKEPKDLAILYRIGDRNQAKCMGC